MNERIAYSTLNLSVEASPKEIVKAYRSMTLKFHPDKNKEYDSSQEFIKVQEAFEFLMQKLDFNSSEREAMIKRYTRQANADKAYKDKLKEQLKMREEKQKLDLLTNIKQLIQLNNKK